jgi:curli production assembly/transport component CsgF
MRIVGLLLTAGVALGIGSAAIASEIVYHPVNPSFGGNPLNGTALLSQAQAQGQGVKSGSQGPDLSGLDAALSNIGSGAVIIGGNGSNGTGTSGTGTGTSTTNTNAVRAIVY